MTPPPDFIELNEPLHIRWRNVALLCALLTCASLVALEVGARSMGALPSVDSSPSFWARERTRSDLLKPKSLVLIGSSRFKETLDPDILATYLPQQSTIHQLSINGGNALPLLEHLAQDTEFRGDLLVDILPMFLSHDRTEDFPVQKYIQHYEQSALYSPLERELSAMVQGNVAIFSQSADFKKWMKLRRVAPDAMVMTRRETTRRIVRHAQRSFEYDEKKDQSWVDQWTRSFEPRSAQQTEATLERWRAATKTLRARGSTLTFFRMTSCSHVLAMETKLAPREDFYDRWERALGGRWIHFSDDPVLSGLSCHDGSHIIGEDATTLNRRLSELLASPQAAPAAK